MKRCFAVIAVFVAFTSAFAQTDWPHNDFDAGIPLLTFFGNYDESRFPRSYTQFIKAIPDGRDGFWIAMRYFISNTLDSLLIQHVDRNGKLAFPLNNVAKFSLGVFSFQSVIDEEGGIIFLCDGLDNTIKGQRISRTGQFLWGTSGKIINSKSSGVRNVIKIDNNYFVLSLLDGYGKPYLQKFNSSGDIEWQSGGIPLTNTKGVNFCKETRLFNIGGRILALWENDDSVFISRVNSADGTLLEGNEAIFLWKYVDKGHFVSNVVQDALGNSAYIAFSDKRYGANSSDDIFLIKFEEYRVKFLSDTGIAVCKYVGSQYAPKLTMDGQNGIIISWYDERNIVQQGRPQIFAQRWSGSDMPAWSANGIQVSANYFSPHIDWLGPIVQKDGFVFAMEEEKNSYAQKISLSGQSMWNVSPQGKINSFYAHLSDIVNDNAGNMYCVYYPPGMMKRLDVNGYLGDNAPNIAKVKDVINDQGGKVSVLFNAAWFDRNPPANQYGNSNTYRVYRGLSASNVSEGAQIVSEENSITPQSPKTFLNLSTTTSAGEPIYWEQVAEVVPAGLNGYSKIIATTSDSGKQGIPWNYFMTAYGNYSSVPQVIWYSNIDSGYSVDNLPPFAPQGFAGAFDGSKIFLHWKKNTEVDLGWYEIYRSTTANFIPSAETKIAEVVDTLYYDVSLQQNTKYYYIARAFDWNGNASENSVQITFTITNVTKENNAGPAEFALHQNFPNPFNPVTTIRFSVGTNARSSSTKAHGWASVPTTLKIYDALGREVATLVNEEKEPGRYAVQWNASKFSSGLYFTKLQIGGNVQIKKMLLTK